MQAFFSCLVWGLRAPLDGGVAGIKFGLGMSPRMSTFMQLLTSYALPLFFGVVCGVLGLVLGCLALIGSAVEAVAQLFRAMPYARPISRILVDWVPVA